MYVTFVTQEVTAPKGRSRRDVSFPPLTPERQALAAEAMPRALRIAHRHNNVGPQREHNRRSDVESDATFAAVCAAGTYRPGERVWQSWSSMRIKHACKYHYRAKWYNRRKFVDSNVWIPGLGETVRNMADLVADRRPGPTEQVASADAFEAMMDLLPPWESTVMRLIYVADLTQTEVAERVNIDVCRVWRLHHSAIERLRGLMGGGRRHECA